ncbi:MAG TPA: MATE family efflux transporter [Synergistales bacterium]|nr:MATE family efflux transporter [Synergistaceae bacterium]HPE65345.1 MATE family efflux transporter [Synergistales bacterium]
MEKENTQYLKMIGMPVGKLILSLSVPTIVSMLVTAIYNIGDTYFVSQLGTSASGAVGIVFSLMAIIQAVGFTVGMGSGAQISRLLGAKKVDEANTVAASGLFAAIGLGSLVALFGLLFLDDLMRVLGATETILPYARDYASYILYAAPVMASSFLLNNILRAEGKAKFAMVGLTTGGLLNLALDPLFIFGFGWGIAGAAIATAISQCVSFGILFSWFLRGKTIVRLSAASISRSPLEYLRILKNGFPSFCRQALASIATIALNVNAAVYGDAAVAAMSIVGRLFMFVFVVNLGIGQGYMPVAGYNYGAGRFDRVKAAFLFTLKVTSAMMTLSGIAAFMAAPSLIRIFIKTDPDVVRIGALALRAMCFAMPLIPLGVVCNMTFQSIGKSWTATVLSLARQGIFFLPLILVLPRFIGLTGVQITQPLADALTFLCCLPLAFFFFKELDAMSKTN